MQSLITELKILICAGSGGVGKTTLSATMGVAAAKAGRNTLVLTIDPARRLATALGITSSSRVPVKVPLSSSSGELHAAVIHPEEAFKEFVTQSSEDPATAQRIFENSLFRQLSTNLSGSQEFTSLHCLLEYANKYDLVILDTPPAQHAMDFLTAPERLYTLFQSSITQWFIRPEASQSLLQKVLNKGTHAVMTAFQKVTGAEFIQELADFFSSVKSIQKRIGERSVEAHKLLTSPQCGFMLVTGFDEVKLIEAEEFHQALVRGGYRLVSVIVNRAFPMWLMGSESEQMPKELSELYHHLKSFYQVREKAYLDFQQTLGNEVPLVRLPELNIDVVGLEALDLLSKQLSERLLLAKKGGQSW